MEPYTQTSLLNEEMKNPHLVETVIHVLPSTGKRIESASVRQAEILEILKNKLQGQIPEFDVNFNVQGIPLLLTKQSYLQLQLTPVFNQQLQILTKYLRTPLSFEYNRALWPKVNAFCVSQASATFSNFSVENPQPGLLPYLKYYRMPEDLRLNFSRAWNPSYIRFSDGGSFTYGNRYFSMQGNGYFSQPLHRSPYEVSALLAEEQTQVFSWYGQPLLIQIPLEDLLPVFQVPVIPLRQTNTSNINIRLRLRSPRHMFFSSWYLNPATAASFRSGTNIEQDSAKFEGIDTITNGYMFYTDNTENIGNEGFVTADQAKDIKAAVVGGGTTNWLKAITTIPYATYGSLNSFMVDFDVDCELVLKALTTPLLNPLVHNYIEPFIDEQNQFVAHFTDYYTYSQTLYTNLSSNMRFVFNPSQLFYNTTHIVLFFLQDVNQSSELDFPKALSQPIPTGNMASLFAHGHFVLREDIDIYNFQIGLGSSVTPLFDRPLTMAEMMTATEDSMMKYNPNEMYGDLLFIQNRFQEGDAFFMFDITHARNSGYFIDADNMIRIEGNIQERRPLERNLLVNANGASVNPDTVQNTGRMRALFQYDAANFVSNDTETTTRTGTTRTGTTRTTDEENNVQPLYRSLDKSKMIHVMMMLLWQNTFTVILDLDGAVLFQQQ